MNLEFSKKEVKKWVNRDPVWLIELLNFSSQASRVRRNLSKWGLLRFMRKLCSGQLAIFFNYSIIMARSVGKSFYRYSILKEQNNWTQTQNFLPIANFDGFAKNDIFIRIFKITVVLKKREIKNYSTKWNENAKKIFKIEKEAKNRYLPLRYSASVRIIKFIYFQARKRNS